MITLNDCENCLIDCVGIRNCCIDNKTDCKHYIDDLPGISNELAFNLADLSKDKGFIDFYSRSRKNAYVSFKQDVLSALNKQATFKGTLRKTKRAKPVRPLNLIKSDAEYLGHLISLYDNANQKLIVNSLMLYSETAFQDLEIKILDLNTNETITITADINIGTNVIELNYEGTTQFDEELILIYFENKDGLSLYEMDCGGKQFAKCSPCLCTKHIDKAIGSIAFDNISDIIIDDYGFLEQDPFCLDAKVVCDIDSLICDYKDEFCIAFKYKWAIEILTEKLVSYNLNYFTQSNLSIIEQGLIPDFTKEYYKHLNRAVKNMVDNATQDSVCFDCMPESGGVYFTSR